MHIKVTIYQPVCQVFIILDIPQNLAKAKTELRLLYFGLFLQFSGKTGKDIA